MPQSIFAHIPEALSDELFATLFANAAVKIERIVSRGHTTPEGEWYEQAQAEWILLVQGSATLLFASGEQWQLRAGDYALIPAQAKHRVTATALDTDSIWLAVHIFTEFSPMG